MSRLISWSGMTGIVKWCGRGCGVFSLVRWTVLCRRRSGKWHRPRWSEVLEMEDTPYLRGLLIGLGISAFFVMAVLACAYLCWVEDGMPLWLPDI